MLSQIHWGFLYAMDTVTALPPTQAGHRYVLVVCEYTTYYPEAVLMQPTDAR